MAKEDAEIKAEIEKQAQGKIDAFLISLTKKNRLNKVRYNAATKFQSIFRGHAVRDRFKKPEAEPTDYKAFIRSNEKPFEIPKEHKFSHGKFALVGCSCFRNLEIIAELIDWDSYETGRPGGIDNIPKLYIVDNSANVMRFWSLLKKAFIYSRSFDSLECGLDIRLLEFSELNIASDLDKTERDLQKSLKALQVLDKDRFDFIKAVVLKATILQHSWTEIEPFEYIKKTCSLPLVAYPSNIYECISGVTRLSVIQSKILTEKLLSNIELLCPELTLHTRTDESFFYMERNTGSFKIRIKPAINICRRFTSIDEERLAIESGATEADGLKPYDIGNYIAYRIAVDKVKSSMDSTTRDDRASGSSLEDDEALVDPTDSSIKLGIR